MKRKEQESTQSAPPLKRINKNSISLGTPFISSPPHTFNISLLDPNISIFAQIIPTIPTQVPTSLVSLPISSIMIVSPISTSLQVFPPPSPIQWQNPNTLPFTSPIITVPIDTTIPSSPPSIPTSSIMNPIININPNSSQ